MSEIGYVLAFVSGIAFCKAFAWASPAFGRFIYENEMERAGWVHWGIRQYPDGPQKCIYRYLGK